MSSEQKYLINLIKANLIESGDHIKCMEMLKECISLFDKSIQSIRPYDKQILEFRVKYLKKLPKDFTSRVKKVRLSNVSTTHSSSQSTGQSTVHSSSASSVGNSAVVSKATSVAITPSGALPSIIESIFLKLKSLADPTFEEYLAFYESLMELLPKKRTPIMKDESEIVYYIGDTHGSFKEALIMIDYFEKAIEKQSNLKIVFVGDYVDRNPNDLENLTVIIAFSLLYPSNVILLRGNHEDEKINHHYGFYKNLQDNFIIQDRVDQLYEKMITYFTYLPVGHIHKLNNRKDPEITIFASHGGIPVDLNNFENPIKLSDLNKSLDTSPKSYLEFSDSLSWLLWADPKEDLAGIVADPSTGRSQFGPSTFNRFMEANNLNFMVRAHEKWPNGHKFFFNDRLVSLFSTSYYNNKKIGTAAFIRLEPGKAPTLLTPNEQFLENDLMNI
jgi:Calcineurin-like phosphoesterase